MTTHLELDLFFIVLQEVLVSILPIAAGMAFANKKIKTKFLL